MAKQAGEVLQGQAIQRGALGAAVSPTTVASVSDPFSPFYNPLSPFYNPAKDPSSTLYNPADPVDLGLLAPGSCFTDQTCTFSVTGNITAVQVQLVIRNLQTGVTININLNPSGPINLATTPAFFNVKLNEFLAHAPQLLPVVCGSGVGLQVEGVATDTSGTLHTSPNLTTTFVKSPCFTTEVRQFRSNTQQFFNCIGLDGTIGVAGVLVHCGSVLGFGVCQAFPNTLVRVGLLDPSTNTFFEYVRAMTDGSGNFSVGFGIKNRPEVAALVPFAGGKKFSIVALFSGDDADSPSPMASIPVEVRGQGAAPCFLGTVLASQTFPTTVPAGQMVHEITTSQTVNALDIQGTAQKVITSARDAIVGAGANPIDITVYRGPDAVLLGFEGLGQITVPTMTVVSHSWGSPVAPLVILLAIVAALILLGIIVYFILQSVRDIVRLPGGAAALTAVGVAVAVVAAGGLALLLLRSRGPKR